MSWEFTSNQILHVYIHSNFIHNCQNLEATMMPFSRWMDKLTIVRPKMDCYSALKGTELSSCEKIWWKCKCILPSKRRQSEKITFSKILTIWYSRKGKTRETVRSVVVKGWKGGRNEEAEHRGVSGLWNFSAWFDNGYPCIVQL